jgi:outer membrane lipoprotein-sorting protein
MPARTSTLIVLVLGLMVSGCGGASTTKPTASGYEAALKQIQGLRSRVLTRVFATQRILVARKL